jgi:branched-chain amino acid transport system ATP-binding protein
MLLEARGLTVTFGGLVALHELSLEVEAGALVGLIGPNGAGKTTAIDALGGFVPHRGRVLVGGTDLTGRPPHERARAGLARTWQSGELFADLTLRENCLVVADRRSPMATLAELWRPVPSEAEDRALAALARVGLVDVADQLPGELPLGHRTLAGVARALAADPAFLLLDEPAAGLRIDETRLLGETLRRLADEGLGVLLVDHDMGLVLSVCRSVTVLDFGRVLASGPPAEIRRDREVVAAYLGSVADQADQADEAGRPARGAQG